MRRLLALLLVTIPAALLASPAAAPADGDVQRLQRDIDSLIGAAACQSDGECRSLPLGQRACGGPELYRAYAQGPAAQRLLELAEQHRKARRAQQARSGRAGICQLLADPGARCDHQQQRCVLRDSR